MKQIAYIFFTIIIISVLNGCSSQETSNFIQQNLVHLNNGTPKEVKVYFENKIKEGNGGLHTYNFSGKTYLMLLEQNRMINSIEEYNNYIRIITSYAPSSPEGGTFNGDNKIPTVLYIHVINEIKKPFGIFREEQLE